MNTLAFLPKKIAITPEIAQMIHDEARYIYAGCGYNSREFIEVMISNTSVDICAEVEIEVSESGYRPASWDMPAESIICNRSEICELEIFDKYGELIPLSWGDTPRVDKQFN